MPRVVDGDPDDPIVQRRKREMVQARQALPAPQRAQLPFISGQVETPPALMAQRQVPRGAFAQQTSFGGVNRNPMFGPNERVAPEGGFAHQLPSPHVPTITGKEIDGAYSNKFRMRAAQDRANRLGVQPQVGQTSREKLAQEAQIKEQRRTGMDADLPVPQAPSQDEMPQRGNYSNEDPAMAERQYEFDLRQWQDRQDTEFDRDESRRKELDKATEKAVEQTEAVQEFEAKQADFEASRDVIPDHLEPALEAYAKAGNVTAVSFRNMMKGFADPKTAPSSVDELQLELDLDIAKTDLERLHQERFFHARNAEGDKTQLPNLDLHIAHRRDAIVKMLTKQVDLQAQKRATAASVPEAADAAREAGHETPSEPVAPAPTQQPTGPMGPEAPTKPVVSKPDPMQADDWGLDANNLRVFLFRDRWYYEDGTPYSEGESKRRGKNSTRGRFNPQE